jgi:DNA-binding NarL/FixJ family response regulator
VGDQTEGTETVMLAITQARVPRLDTAPRQSGRSQAETPPLTKILVVDHHFLIREALCKVLKQLKGNATILEAVDGRQAMQLVAEHPDTGVVLLELNLPDRDGFSLLGELRERHPETSVVVLSARHDRDSVARALDLGALGFIPKSGQWAVMVRALELVFAGGVYIPPEMLSSEERPHPSPEPACIVPGPGLMPPADLGLTDRQVEVLRLMMQGKSNKTIARELNISLPTVKNHVTAILGALKVANRTEAVIAALDMDWERPATEAPAAPEEARPSLVG